MQSECDSRLGAAFTISSIYARYIQCLNFWEENVKVTQALIPVNMLSHDSPILKMLGCLERLMYLFKLMLFLRILAGASHGL